MAKRHPLQHWALLFLLSLICLTSAMAQHSEEPSILVFSKTEGFQHESIPEGTNALVQLGKESNLKVDTTTNATLFTDESLKAYDAVVFFNTTGDVLNEEQQRAFEKFIRAGNGFMGIHSAADTEHDWEWYGLLVGGYFKNHPEVQEALLQVKNRQHPSTAHLPGQWTRKDEYYNFKELNDKVNVLMTIDEDSYQGGENGPLHPMAWYHEYEGGRAFYTALGHTNESYKDPQFLQHLLGGILYVVGD